MKSQIHLGLHQLQNSHGANVQDGLELFVNPGAVLTNRKYSSKELVLIPVTTLIKDRKSSDLCEKGYDLGELLPGIKFSLQHQFASGRAKADDDFTPPFWLVESNEDGNMKIDYVPIKGSIDCTSSTYGGPATKSTFKLPVMVNPAAIDKSAAVVLKVDSGSKRQRT